MTQYRRFLRNPVMQNAMALYGAQAMGFLVPLITLPYIARVLNPAGLGLVNFSLSFTLWLIIVIEFGFNFSATREIAQNRLEPERISVIAAGVMGAKVLLICLAVVVCGLVALLVPLFSSNPQYLLWAFISAVPQGLSPLWYFQGKERMVRPAVIDISFRLVAMIAIFLIVKEPNDGWKILAIQALSSLCSISTMFFLMYREVDWRRPSFAMIESALRLGWSMFLYRIAVSFYTTANPFILGLLLPSSATHSVQMSSIGFYSGASQLIAYTVAPFQPLGRILLPRISYLAKHDLAKAQYWMRRISLVVGGVGLGLAFGVALLAPQIISFFLGAGYEPAQSLLMVLAFSIPCIAIGGILGVLWMVALGLERLFNGVTIGAGLLNIALAFILVPSLGTLGMAISVVISELGVVLGLVFVLLRVKHAFWQR